MSDNSMNNSVTSKDGTKIVYSKQGTGPAVILIGGGLDDGSENAPLGAELAAHFTVYNYARRGRGGSGDTLPYALEREFEDIEALITEAGGSAHVFGASSGGALALEAAAAGLPINKIAVYETPYSMDDDRQKQWNEYVKKLTAALAKDDRDEASALFMILAGSSEQDVEGVKQSPYWEPTKALAHTLAYDAACLRDGRPPKNFAQIQQPVLVATGNTANPYTAGLTPEFFNKAADALVALLPHAERSVFKGQSHILDPKIGASILEEFFNK